jgi:hypothetical protein
LLYLIGTPFFNQKKETPVEHVLTEKKKVDLVLGIIRGPNNTILLTRKNANYVQWILPGGPIRASGDPKKNLIGILEQRIGFLIDERCVTFAEYYQKPDHIIHVYNVEMTHWNGLPTQQLNMRPFEKSNVIKNKNLILEHHKIFEEVEKQYQSHKLSYQRHR